MPKLPDNEMLGTKHNRKHALDHTGTNRREAAHGSPYHVQQADTWLYPCPRKFQKSVYIVLQNVSDIRDGYFMEESSECPPSC